MSIPKAWSSAVVACAMIAVACGPDGPTAAGSDGRAFASGDQSDASPSATSAEVLVFGPSGDSGERGQLVDVLTDLGHAVTSGPELPSDLSPYDVIWHVAFTQALTSDEQDRLAEFLAGGGGVHLTGEFPGVGATLNGSLQDLVNTVVVGGGVTMGTFDLGTAFGPGFTFNPEAVGGITTVPRELDAWAPQNAGRIAGVSGANVLVREDAFEEAPTGAVWECGSLVGGVGQLTVLMDVDWLGVVDNDANSPELRDPQIENIQSFLQRRCGGAAPVLDVDIDIQPGGSPNSINVIRAHGVIPVAVLGSDDFDVRDLDPATLVFGDLAEDESTGPAHRRAGHFEDVNGDGFEDLVMHFPTADTGIDPGDTEACLAGETTSGTAVRGCDSVRTVPAGGSARRGPA